jgi:membrane protein
MNQDTIQRIKNFSLPGFEGIPLLRLLRFVIKEIQKEGLVMRSSSVTFFFILSIFPGLIFLFTLIPYLPVKNVHTQLLLTIKDIINNKEAYQMIRATINDIAEIQHQGLMSFGFVFSIFSAMSGVKALLNAFDKAYEHAYVKRNVIQHNWTALKLTFMIAILLLGSLILIIAEKTVFEWIYGFFDIRSEWIKWFFDLLRYIIILALFFFTISSIYFYGPAVKERFRFISAGSTFATLLFILTSLLFSYFVNNFGTYNKVYGSIGSIIVIMLWMYFNCMVLILGYEINAGITILKLKDKTAEN